MPRAEERCDLLGTARSRLELKITRRCSVQTEAERRALLLQLDGLGRWAARNPPPGFQVRAAALPDFCSRSSSGAEDLSLTLFLREF